jgi:tetratricopeptide (TPR) repeat protein
MNTRDSATPVSSVLPNAAVSILEDIRNLTRAGCCREALARVPELDAFESDNPPLVTVVKGILLADIAEDLRDLECARRAALLLKAVPSEGLPAKERHKHLYNLGRSHAVCYDLKSIPAGLNRCLDQDFGESKRWYRAAMGCGSLPPDSRARLYTNYGILLRSVGRHVEEIEAYDEALKAVPDFAMALWHKGKGLRWYSRLVEPPTKRSALVEAWSLIKRSLEVGLEPGRQAKAEKELAELGRILGQPKPPAERHTEHRAHSDVEATYIKFCVENRLYLHPCPVHAHGAYQDPLAVRFPTSVKGEFLELRSDALALIKQEYVASRFLLFCYRSKQPDLSFVDRGTYIPSVQQGDGQIYLQLLILSFRAAYAILDKIAFFLNTFCRLGEKENRVFFHEGLFVADAAVKPTLTKFDGPQLAALFDLAREFSKGQPLCPLRDLRHKLEHRCVTVRRAQDSAKGHRSNDTKEGRTCTTPLRGLTDSDLYESTLRLLRAVRAAVFYLFYFVRKWDEPRATEVP